MESSRQKKPELIPQTPPVAGSIPAGPTGERPLTRHDARSGVLPRACC